MKINFDTEHTYNESKINNQISINRISSEDARVNTSVSFAVSFGENNAMSIFADKQDPQDMQTKLSVMDVQAKQNYMAVMSLSMSDEDYAQLAKTGEAPEDMDVSDSVTIIDEIKAALIKGGTKVNGYTDDIDRETLLQITGSEANANSLIKGMHEQDVPVNEENVQLATKAIDMAVSSLPLSDNATQYLLENDKAPTVKNVYQASHSGGSFGDRAGAYYSQNGYMSMAADSADIEALKPQIDEIIKESGISDTDKAYKEAEFLINRGMPLTTESLLKLHELSDIREAVDKGAIVDSVAIAMSAGINPVNANLLYNESIYTKAETLTDEISNISDNAVVYAAKQNITLSIRNLTQIDKEQLYSLNNAEAATNTENTDIKEKAIDLAGESAEEIHARRLLEEVRLSMTVQANRLLLKSNFQIDVAPMEKLIEALKAAEQAINSSLFPSENIEATNSKASIYEQAKSELTAIPSLPAAILGQTREGGAFKFAADQTFTLHDVYESGISRQQAYAQAGERYEALMTAPRSDMGDSIRKAFRNVDDILEDMKIEVNDANRRAVRILGYNSMEITAENIEQVREADLNLRRVMEGLTPGRVLSMIREDINPLTMTVSELNNYLDSKDEDPERKAQNYAKFLMQLEKHDEISELEKESYIGIYRMLNSLEKGDDRAVGSILKMGSQMTFSNLLSAMRTAAKSTINISVDDEFAGVDSIRKNAAIDDQINAAFGRSINENLASYDESVVENLINMGQSVSPMNLEAMSLIRQKRGDWFKTVNSLSFDTDELEQSINEALEEMTDDAPATSAYTSLMDGFINKLSKEVYEQDSFIDVKAIQMSMRQISLLKRNVSEREFEFPTVIDGEATSVRLTLRRREGAGLLSITFETEKKGKVAAEFDLGKTKSGFIAYERENNSEVLESIAKQISSDIGFEPELVYVSKLDLDKFTDKTSEKEKANDVENKTDINSTELYRIARKFISAVKHI